MFFVVVVVFSVAPSMCEGNESGKLDFLGIMFSWKAEQAFTTAMLSSHFLFKNCGMKISRAHTVKGRGRKDFRLTNLKSSCDFTSAVRFTLDVRKHW